MKSTKVVKQRSYKSPSKDAVMRRFSKWIDAMAVGLGFGLAALTCAGGNLPQCVSALTALRTLNQTMEIQHNVASDQ